MSEYLSEGKVWYCPECGITLHYVHGQKYVQHIERMDRECVNSGKLYINPLVKVQLAEKEAVK